MQQQRFGLGTILGVVVLAGMIFTTVLAIRHRAAHAVREAHQSANRPKGLTEAQALEVALTNARSKKYDLNRYPKQLFRSGFDDEKGMWWFALVPQNRGVDEQDLLIRVNAKTGATEFPGYQGFMLRKP